VQAGVGATGARAGVDRSPRGDEELMVEEGTTERGLEKMIGDHIVRRTRAVQVCVYGK
jgi:hypothetical protein